MLLNQPLKNISKSSTFLKFISWTIKIVIKQKKKYSYSQIFLRSPLPYLEKTPKFYLYLRLYQLAPLRDNFQLKIITDAKEAIDKNTNYIILPPVKTSKVRNKNKTLVHRPIGSLIIRTYITKNRHGELTYPLTTEVTNLVRDFIERNKINIGDYLFGNYAMSSYVSGELKKMGIAEKHQGINFIRHAVSSLFHILNRQPQPRG